MKSLLQHIKAITTACIVEVRDEKLWYHCFFYSPEDPMDQWQLMVPVPLEDLKGGTFPASMYADDPDDPDGARHPKLLQRWIRKALEEQQVIEDAIAANKAGQNE